VDPKFLDQVVGRVRRASFDIVSLDEAHFRLTEGDVRRPFVCLCFDDGYKDTLEFAYPVLRRHGLPFAIYVASDYPSGHGDPWWLALEEAVGRVDRLEARIDGALRRLRCVTPSEKERTYRRLYHWLRVIDEKDARAFVLELCANAGLESHTLGRELLLSWDEIRQLAADPLVTIGAHTRRHYALAKLTLAEAFAEIEESVRRIERELDRPCRHFAYAYGDPASAGPREFSIVKELGLKTGVTTRQGPIGANGPLWLMALPSIWLDGSYKNAAYVSLYIGGAPFVVSRRRRLPW
jgi:peptidoglycan/xylan/chitin deacetylase (PgdA/CDA1 family)